MRKNGFTILEALVATLLVGVCLFAVMEAFNRGLLGMSDVGRYSLALSLAEEKMEEIRASSFDDVASEAKAPVAGFAGLERQVDIVTPHADLKQVSVTTYWSVLNAESELCLATYVVNRE